MTAFFVGCGTDHSSTGQHDGDPGDAMVSERSASSTPALTCSHQVYDSAGARNVKATLDDPEFSEIQAMLEDVFSDPSSPRARVVLTRNADAGHLIVLTRTSGGELELGVTMKTDGRWFEAKEPNIESLSSATEVFRAFYDSNADIQTLIEWDEVVE